jgi:hypothetical protein
VLVEEQNVIRCANPVATARKSQASTLAACWRRNVRPRGVEGRNRMRIALVTVAVVAAAAVVGVAAPSSGEAGRDPTPLHGMPLRAPTGLRFVVADNPPLVIDLDAARATPLRRVPTLRRGVCGLSVLAGSRQLSSPVPSGAMQTCIASVAARRAWSSSAMVQTSLPRPMVDPSGSRASRGRDARSGSARSKGLKSERPVLFRVRRRSPPPARSASSSTAPVSSIRTLAGYCYAHGWVCSQLQNGSSCWRAGRTFTISDAAGRVLRRIPWPSTVGGLDAPAAHPRGRYVALAFAEPAAQVLDVWLLDTKTPSLAPTWNEWVSTVASQTWRTS